MSLGTFRDFCLSLPHTTEDMLFGEEILVFQFVLTNLESIPLRASLKCTPDRALSFVSNTLKYHLNKKTLEYSFGRPLPSTLIEEIVHNSYEE